ncbi:hypothetical protein Bpfe_016781 [Biomphalaria pfeifferi]|uniref:Uncharacterized protein n=1 Tax=Biomphalaria pfeifferi TaxID=112525 RepID=A0AAD8BFR9_BIOPF|nr:hypothetical protein Bpfe_016781 [Biomphalaria pfeifferi]
MWYLLLATLIIAGCQCVYIYEPNRYKQTDIWRDDFNPGGFKPLRPPVYSKREEENSKDDLNQRSPLDTGNFQKEKRIVAFPDYWKGSKWIVSK